MRAFNNSGAKGTVSFKETNDKGNVVVHLEASGLIPDSTYQTHLHKGVLGNLISTYIYFHNAKTGDGKITHDENWAMTFDDALVSNTCFTVHNPTFFSNDSIGYVLGVNTGANE